MGGRIVNKKAKIVKTSFKCLILKTLFAKWFINTAKNEKKGGIVVRTYSRNNIPIFYYCNINIPDLDWTTAILLAETNLIKI